MGDQRDGGIGWTDRTWGILRGCSRVSPGCGGAKGEGGCYAEKMAGRFSKPGMWGDGLVRIGKQGARWTGKVYLVREKLTDPLHWKTPQKIFVNSASDPWHENFADGDIDKLFAYMGLAWWHQYQILTKRADRMLAYFQGQPYERILWHAAKFRNALPVTRQKLRLATYPPNHHHPSGIDWPMRNVWLGVSAEDQIRAVERIPLLLRTPAAIRFVSVEPMLGRVDLTRIHTWRGHALSALEEQVGHVERPRLNWCIVGAESGTGARPFDVDWARSLRDQCKSAGVAFFGKQDAVNGKKKPLLIDGVEVKEFPRA